MIQVTDFCKNDVTSITTCYINNYKKEYEIFHISNITHIYIYIYIFFFFFFSLKSLDTLSFLYFFLISPWNRMTDFESVEENNKYDT